MESLRLRRGFSLVELLVVLGIIGVITAIVITSQNGFNKTITLVNTTYDMALSLRSAQTFGLGSRVVNSGGTNVANTPFGIHIDSASNNSYVLFADINPNGTVAGPNCLAADVGTPNCQPGDYVYLAGSDSQQRVYTLNNGIKIQNFCAKNNTGSATGSWLCATAIAGKTDGNSPLTSLDIVFGRPDPDPFISANGAYTAPPSVNQLVQACIIIIPPSVSSCATANACRYIKVLQTGEITANNTSCP